MLSCGTSEILKKVSDGIWTIAPRKIAARLGLGFGLGLGLGLGAILLGGKYPRTVSDIHDSWFSRYLAVFHSLPEWLLTKFTFLQNKSFRLLSHKRLCSTYLY